MNDIFCCKCGEPAAFPKGKTEPWTCLQCETVEQPVSAAAEKPKAVSSSELVRLRPLSEWECAANLLLATVGVAVMFWADWKFASGVLIFHTAWKWQLSMKRREQPNGEVRNAGPDVTNKPAAKTGVFLH